MSGFEVAGIILGGIPLLASLLKGYGEGLAVFRGYLGCQEQLDDIAFELGLERQKIRCVYEKLLLGLVPDSELRDMIDNPMGHLWRQKATLDKIRGRLWESAASFEKIINDIRATIDEFDALIRTQMQKNLSTAKRLSWFLLKLPTFRESLASIKNAVSSLRSITNDNLPLEPQRRIRCQTKLFLVSQNMADSFYRALQASLSCSHLHQIGLQLQSRSANMVLTDDGDRIRKDLSFRLAISGVLEAYSHGANPRIGKVLDWQEIVIKAMCSPPPTLSPPSTTTRRTKATMINRFLHPATLTSSTTTGTSTSATNTLQALISPAANIATSVAFSSTGVSQNLCETLHLPRMQTTFDTYGTLVDELVQPPRTYSICPDSSAEGSRSWSVVSLSDILKQNSPFTSLPYNGRLHLAVAIASSVLQLHGTPWLPSILTSDHFFFFLKRQNALDPAHPVLLQHHPGGVGHPVPLEQFPEEENELVAPEKWLIAKRNPTLLSLGCVLIEVILQRPLNSRRAPATSHTGGGLNLMADFVEAQSLMSEVSAQSPGYAKAVEGCFGAGRDRRGYGLEDAQLCREVYLQVVVLLEEILKAFK